MRGRFVQSRVIAAIDLINAVEGTIVSVVADAAYDTIAVYGTAGMRGARVVVPPGQVALSLFAVEPVEGLL